MLSRVINCNDNGDKVTGVNMLSIPRVKFYDDIFMLVLKLETKILVLVLREHTRDDIKVIVL